MGERVPVGGYVSAVVKCWLLHAIILVMHAGMILYGVILRCVVNQVKKMYRRALRHIGLTLSLWKDVI